MFGIGNSESRGHRASSLAASFTFARHFSSLTAWCEMWSGISSYLAGSLSLLSSRSESGLRNSSRHAGWGHRAQRGLISNQNTIVQDPRLSSMTSINSLCFSKRDLRLNDIFADLILTAHNNLLVNFLVSMKIRDAIERATDGQLLPLDMTPHHKNVPCEIVFESESTLHLYMTLISNTYYSSYKLIARDFITSSLHRHIRG